MELSFPKMNGHTLALKKLKTLESLALVTHLSHSLRGFPADNVFNKYIIEFSENFIYQNGDVIEITSDPKGT